MTSPIHLTLPTTPILAFFALSLILTSVAEPFNEINDAEISDFLHQYKALPAKEKWDYREKLSAICYRLVAGIYGPGGALGHSQAGQQPEQEGRGRAAHSHPRLHKEAAVGGEVLGVGGELALLRADLRRGRLHLLLRPDARPDRRSAHFSLSD